MVGVTRGPQIVHNDEEQTGCNLAGAGAENIGDLARGPGAERYAH
jgi:hypothetical protein